MQWHFASKDLIAAKASGSLPLANQALSSVLALCRCVIANCYGLIWA